MGWSCSTFYGINGQGAGDNQLDHPGGLWIDTANNLYNADTNNNRIMKCTPADSCSVLIPASGNGATGVVASDGQIFLTLYDQSQIAEYNPDGSFDQYFAGIANVAYLTSLDPAHPMLNGPHAIDVDAKGKHHCGRGMGQPADQALANRYGPVEQGYRRTARLGQLSYASHRI